MMVLGMVVIGVLMDVQRGGLAGSANHGQADHNGDHALHNPSVWKDSLTVKLPATAKQADHQSALLTLKLASGWILGCMGDCCSPSPEALVDQSCPQCHTKGAAVDVQTVKALLTEIALRRLDPDAAHRFCADPACRVVYFDECGQVFTVDDVRARVWQKEAPGARMICYCFDESEAAIRNEIDRHGASRAAERVREHIAAHRCACEVRNPRGVCCLGDVIAAVKRIASEVHASA